jgi:hypothetical protein
MGNYAVIYVKVIDNKKDGISIQGPTVSDITETEIEANEEARRLVNEARNSTIIPRIYTLESITELEAKLLEAKSFFQSMHDNMSEAKAALSRPVHRRKRRKMKKATEKNEPEA